MCSRGWKEYIQYDYLTIKEPDATRCYVAKVQYLQSQLANDLRSIQVLLCGFVTDQADLKQTLGRKIISLP